ncbi:uncharacterized protein LOC123204938 [Mangifera indica]|uniref:uncharacterized protein LOC123204938 n=1 Tax=Mangifera indica TaxID=29780 RepID=UPI001CF9CC93|nr:uncharacterized protein LOC123204938 [Mangifera indica]
MMESGHEGETSSESKANQTATSVERSSFSSPSSSSYEDLTNEPKTGANGTELALDINEEGFATSSRSRLEQPNDELATESPPAQVMARADDDNLSVDPNRIPSHVFARTKSNALEWSIASNESLFSIHMGNMSFTRDQLSWMGGDIQFSGPLFDLPSMQPPTATSHGNLSLGATEAAAVATMREVIRENDSNDKLKLSLPPEDSSLARDASTKSFAFPILTADEDKSTSVRGSIRGKKQQSLQLEMPKAAEPGTPAPPQRPEANNKAAGRVKRYSCFSCCSIC